jgi:hypothetical protein
MFERCFNWFTGSTVPALGVVVSFQTQLDAHLRTASLILGLIVGLISLYNVIRKL